MSTIKGVTARVAHACEGCSVKTVNGVWTTPILPGHRYLLHTAFPGDDGFEEMDSPFSIRECARCAHARDVDASMLYLICGSYCCGTEPCALPFQPVGTPAPGHEHVCHRCASERERELATAGGPVGVR